MKNHLFIGVGGTGTRVLAELKRVMLKRADDTAVLGKDGVKWDFLSIDSSDDVWKTKEYWRFFGKNIELENRQKIELHPMALAKEIDKLALRPDIAPWIGDVNTLRSYVGNMEGTPGANQRRRFGRVLFAGNADRIRTEIRDKKVRELVTNSTSECAFHIFCTIGGGTGSGCLVDLITAIRTDFERSSPHGGYPIFVYVFCTSDNPDGATISTFFFQNQYCCLRDLNALMAGRFTPPILGEGAGNHGRFSGETPVNSVSLITNTNSRNRNLPLQSQIVLAAEACFERIFTFETGKLKGGQKAITFEDIGTNAGEPARNMERSYRFGSLGMRRWELPNEKIRELIALELLVAGFRQMVYNKWSPVEGYTDDYVTLERNKSDVAFSELSAIEDLSSARGTIGVELERRLDEAMGQFIESAMARSLGLDEFEKSFQSFLATQLGGDGMQAGFDRMEGNRKAIASETLQKIDMRLTKLWVRGDISLRQLFDLIERLKVEWGKRLSPDALPGIAETRATKRALRKAEFGKLTLFSRPIKIKPFIIAHARDLQDEAKAEIFRRCDLTDRYRMEELADGLQILKTKYELARDILEELAKRINREREAIADDLQLMAASNNANRYEIEAKRLEIFIATLRVDQGRVSEACAAFRASIAGDESGRTLSRFRNNDPGADEELDAGLRARALERVGNLHRELTERGIEPVLFDSLMERLQQRLGGNQTEALGREANEFIELAASCLEERRGEIQPSQILGADVAGETMPRHLFVLGIPRHPFTAVLKQAFADSLKGGTSFHTEFYEHDDPLQLRIFVTDYWMAARFGGITHLLHQRYHASERGVGRGDVKYFSNIDPEGEKDQRPGLLSPSAAEERMRLEASLWIGERLSPKVFETTERDEIFVVSVGLNGKTVDQLGTGRARFVESADRLQVERACSAVRARLWEMPQQDRDSLRQAVSGEEQIMSAKDATSPEYRRWTTLRDSILTMIGN